MLEISHEFIFKDFSNNETRDFLNKKSSHYSNSSTSSQVSCNNSSCSSRFSMTDHGEDEDEDEDEESETCDEDDNISNAEDEIMCSIKEFPVQSIIMSALSLGKVSMLVIFSIWIFLLFTKIALESSLTSSLNFPCTLSNFS